VTPLIALVPARDFRTGKSRLASVLNEEARDGLGRWMLGRVLEALGGSGAAAEVAVLSDSPDVLSLAGEHGAAGIRCPARDLNADLEAGRAWALARGAEALLVVPADLPTLRAEEVGRLAARGREEAAGRAGLAVLAPSGDGGTNGLLLRPGRALPFAFGPGSFARHWREAEARSLRVLRFESRGFGLDLDTPSDLDALLGSGASLPEWLAGTPRS